MTRWVVLLRGVNVGGHRKLSMPHLAQLLSAQGFESVRTYIQSGNVLLDSPDHRAVVGRRVTSAIEEEFGLTVSALVRSVDDLSALARSHPGDTGDLDSRWLHVVFLDKPASRAARKKLDGLADQHAPDVWTYSESGRELFVAYPNGSGRSRFTLDVIERQLGVVGTGRNLNTIRHLIDLAGTARK